MDYRSSGVDIDRAERAIARVKERIAGTFTGGVVSIPNGFAGAHASPGTDRLLLASIDGVGSKVTVGRTLGRVRGLGVDLVHHCANDLLVHGGRPLFFLDYVGVGRLSESWFEELLEGLTDACRGVGCALLGGETAEMPDTYAPEDFDLVGAIVGEVSRERLVDGTGIAAGHRLLGLPSSGLHTNGYTLARRIVRDGLGGDWDRPVPGSPHTIGDALLEPHASYGAAVLPLVDSGRITGMAHITGGGLGGNLGRLLPEGVSAHVDTTAWSVPPVFRMLMEAGDVSPEEMFRTFNMGTGFVLVVPEANVPDVRASLSASGWPVFGIGDIRAGGHGVVLHGLR